MNLGAVLLWGPIATVLMTTIESCAQGLGLSRMSMPFLLGTMVTPDRDRAGAIGFLMHVANGIAFAFAYALIFERLGASWWLGGVVGLLHALFVLAALMPSLPAIHPRMSSETAGPDQLRQLQPAGFFALHYGKRTMLVVFLSHAVYGAFLGAMYEPGTRPSAIAPVASQGHHEMVFIPVHLDENLFTGLSYPWPNHGNADQIGPGRIANRCDDHAGGGAAERRAGS